jgi:hypothetical protein
MQDRMECHYLPLTDAQYEQVLALEAKAEG